MTKTANIAKNKALLVLIAALAIAGAATLQAQTIFTATATPGIDSYYNTTNITYNAIALGGYENGLEVGRMLIEFNLSSIPSNATITSATLEVGGTANDVSANTISGYAVTQAWTNTGVTWNTTDGSTPWGTPGGVYNPTPSFSLTSTFNGVNNPPYNIPPYTTPAAYTAVYTDISGAGLTSDVQNWVNGSLANNGWILQNSDELNSSTQIITNYANLDPNAGSGPWGPLLALTYTVPEPGALALLGLGAALLAISSLRRKRVKI